MEVAAVGDRGPPPAREGVVARKAELREPVTPGDLLWEEFMAPMGLSRLRTGEGARGAGPAPRRRTASKSLGVHWRQS